MNEDLKKLELQIGSLGTLLWGFADLLGKVLPHHT